ncbi:MAG: hypothetical protein V3V86_00310 [Gammaproteobacteria bacterium]
MIRRLACIATPLVVAFAALTGWALEWSDVAVLETQTGDGSSRVTRVWYVTGEQQILFVEAGGEDSPWLDDVRVHPVLHFEAEGRSETLCAIIRPNPDGHRDIRQRLRAKYGVRDLWIGWLFDTSTSVEVALVPPARLIHGVRRGSPVQPSAEMCRRSRTAYDAG